VGAVLTPATWRVVDDAGEVRALTLAEIDAHRAEQWDGDSGVPARAVVVNLAACLGWDVAEILAPGALSAAERVAAAHRDGLLRGLALAQEHAVAVIDAGTDAPAIDWTDAVAAVGDDARGAL
jgi:hypothetical protein